MDFYAPLKDFVLWINSLWKKWQLNKQKKLNKSIFKEEDILVVLLEQAYKDGTTARGLTCAEIYNTLPKEKTTSITVDSTRSSIRQHIVNGNIKSASLDPDCNYILTDIGRSSAEEYSKSVGT